VEAGGVTEVREDGMDLAALSSSELSCSAAHASWKDVWLAALSSTSEQALSELGGRMCITWCIRRGTEVHNINSLHTRVRSH